MFAPNTPNLRRNSICLLLVLMLPYVLLAEEIPVQPATMLLAGGTPIKLRLNQTISSANAHPGDPLEFVVATDVVEKGYIVVPAGSAASGEVAGIKHRRFGGMGGQVILKLNYVQLPDGERIGLHARQAVKGCTHTARMVVGMVGAAIFFWPVMPVFLLDRGEDSTVLKGTEVVGHLDGDARVLSAALPQVDRSPSQLNEAMASVPPRVLNREGREGDMVNLIFVAQPDDLQAAFERSGWIKVDKWRPVMAWHLLEHRTHDGQLPMARFYMFGRVQDYAYALPDPNAVMSRRHHLRIWKTDYQVNGTPVWAAAATHDIAIELGKHGRLINHRIDPDVDAERDFVGESLNTTQSVGHQQYLHGERPVYEAQTAAGEDYYSDSRILMLDVHQTMRSQAAAISSPSPILLGWATPTIASTIAGAAAF